MNERVNGWMGVWVSINVLEKGYIVDTQRRCVKLLLICYFFDVFDLNKVRNGLGQYHIMLNAYENCLNTKENRR